MGHGSRLITPKHSIKMLSNYNGPLNNVSGMNDNSSKDFKTITLRGLEEKPELVKIMNDVMKVRDIKTGQGIIEYIIADYAKTKDELKKQHEKARNFSDNHYKVVEEYEAENTRLKTFIHNLQAAFKSVSSFNI